MNKIARYMMNPAEDVILFGDELRDGMEVMLENWTLRGTSYGSEDEHLRTQQFVKVTRLRQYGGISTFVGEWADGYQEVKRVNVSHSWIVKKASIPSTGTPAEGR